MLSIGLWEKSKEAKNLSTMGNLGLLNLGPEIVFSGRLGQAEMLKRSAAQIKKIGKKILL